MLFDLGYLLSQFLILLDVVCSPLVFLKFLVVLGDDLLLELLDVGLHPFEFLLQFSYLRVGFPEVLGIKVPIRSDLLIELLLELKSLLCVDVLLLKLGDQVVLQLDLLQSLIVFGVRLSGLESVSLLFSLQLSVLLVEICDLVHVSLSLVDHLGQLILLCQLLVFVGPLLLLSIELVFEQKLLLTVFALSGLLLVFNISLYFSLLSDFEVILKLFFGAFLLTVSQLLDGSFGLSLL